MNGMVGRDPELRHLAAAIERVRAGQSFITTIEGEPGIGKSTLLDDVVERVAADGWTVLLCRSGELDVDHPFVPVLAGVEDLLSELGAEAPSELHEAAALLRKAGASHLPSSEVALTRSNPASILEQQQGDQIITLLVEGMHELARSGPVLAAFDDAHWIDDASARVLWGLARRRRSSRILTVASFRPTQRPEVLTLRRTLDGQGASNLLLNPLTRSEATVLAQRIIGANLPPQANEVLNDAGGNPLYITELARGIADVETTGAESGPRVPESLRRLVARRLSGLDLLTQSALFDAALLGIHVDLDQLAAVREDDVDTMLTTLAPALDSRILVEHGRGLAFQHGVVQTIIAEHRPLAEQRQRHAHIAQRLAAGAAPAPVVGEHLWLSRPTPSADAHRLLCLAAEDVRVLSLESALNWYRRALEVVTEESRFNTQMEIAALLILVGRFSEAEAIASAAEGAAHTERQEIRRRYTKASLATMAGRTRNEEGREHIEWILSKVGPNDIRAVELLGWRALLCVFAGELDDAVTAANSALAIPVDDSMTDARSRAFEALGLAHLLRGDTEEAEKYTRLATDTYAYEERIFSSIMMPHFARAMALLTNERIEKVIDVLREGYGICDRAGHALGRLHLEPLMGISHYVKGDLDVARRCVERTLQRSEDWSAGGVSLPTASGLAGYIAMLDGDSARAQTLADQAMRELLDGGSQAGSADFAVWCIAAVAEAAGDRTKAAELLVAVWELVAKHASLLTIAPDLVRLTRDDRPEFAAGVVEVARRRTVRSNAALDRANLAASIGFLERSVASLDASAEEFERLGWQFQAYRLRTQALDLVNPKDTETLRVRATACAEYWERVGAVRLLADVNERYRKLLGARPKPASSGPASLSQAELAVARLVADGLSNREIAERLYVSHRTVESHVSHALTKLGVSSRVQLATVVLRAGL